MSDTEAKLNRMHKKWQNIDPPINFCWFGFQPKQSVPDLLQSSHFLQLLLTNSQARWVIWSPACLWSVLGPPPTTRFPNHLKWWRSRYSTNPKILKLLHLRQQLTSNPDERNSTLWLLRNMAQKPARAHQQTGLPPPWIDYSNGLNTYWIRLRRLRSRWTKIYNAPKI